MTIYGFHKLTSTLKSMENVGSDDRYFEGLLTVQMKDKQGEVTIVDELYKVLPVWIDRGAPISDTHSNRIVGKGINYSRTTVKNDEGHELPAIKITGKIFKNYELDNVIWNKIKNNEYKGLSFGGATRSARSPIKMKDGSTAYALSDLEHYEVAVCADPAVPMAIITDFNQIAKANFNSSVRDDGKMVIQCENMGCYVKKDSLIKIEDDEDDNTQVTVLDEWKNETHPDKNGKTEGIRTTKADEDKPLNKPMRDDGDKKFKVYVKDPKTGKTVTVRFGDPNMEIKRDDPERRASFRARHDCDNAKDITTPKYWSCKMWEKETSVTDHTNKADLMTVMEGDKPENYNEVEAGRQRGRAIDKTEPTGLSEEDLKKWRAIQEDDKEDSDNQYYNKFMEKKEMMDAVEDLPDEEKVKKSIVFLEKHGYQVFTEDKNNGTGINDTIREKRRFNGTKGTLSEELPRGIQQANLNESQTFEQKVQALIREGKSRESAEKIVGSFVHKVEASSGSGGAGIGGANMTNGGTITTQTGGANNPIHNSKCQCDKCKNKGLEKAAGEYCSNCGGNKKEMSDMTSMGGACPNCGHGFKPKKPKSADISNTGGGGTTEQAFNQNPPNAQRLNNKADDELNEKFGDPTKPLILDSHKDTRIRNQIADIQNSHNKADDEEDEEVQSPEEEERPEWQWLMNRHKSKATREVNKVHALLKLNKVRGKMPKPSKDYTEDEKLDQIIQRETENFNQHQAHFSDGRHSNNESSKAPDIQDRLTSREYTSEGKKPNKKRGSDRDDTNDPPTPKIRYSRGGDTAARQLKMSLDELDKTMTYQKTPANVEMKYPTVGEEVWDSKQQKRVKETKTPKRTMALEKSLNELKKLHISGGVGSRGLGAAGGYTQGQGETTQITIVQPRPTDDRVEAKRIPKKVTKIRANRGVGAFGSDLPDGSKNEAPVADENTRYIDHNGKAWKTQAEADAVPPRKRRNLRAERARRATYNADTRQTIGQRTGNSKP